MTKKKEKKPKEASFVDALRKATTVKELQEFQRSLLGMLTLASMQLENWTPVPNTPKKLGAIKYWADRLKKAKKAMSIINYRLERQGRKGHYPFRGSAKIRLPRRLRNRK